MLSSSNHNDAVDDTAARKPLMISEYNKLSAGSGSRRWPLGVFCNVLDIAALNSLVLGKASLNGSCMS